MVVTGAVSLLRLLFRVLRALLVIDLVYAAWPVLRSGLEGQITWHQAWVVLIHDAALYPLVIAVLVLTVLSRSGGATLMLVIGAVCLALSFGLVHASNVEQKVLGQRQASAVQRYSQRCGLNLQTYDHDGRTFAQESVPGSGVVHYLVTLGHDGVAQFNNAVNGQPVSLPCNAVGGR